MAGRSWHVGELRRIDVLNVGQLANGLVDDALLVVARSRVLVLVSAAG